jgi:multidrug efflux pump subunit AcrA (membrane-fusion protein)
MKVLFNSIPGCFIIVLLIVSCNNKQPEPGASKQAAGTPVEITSIQNGELSEQLELNATSSFLLKTAVKSNATGYVTHLKIHPGDHVNKGEILFSIITKEARTLGNTVNRIDTSFHFKGEINIPAPGSGYITQLDLQEGDYVQEGDQMAMISDERSFAFVLNLPFELTSLLSTNRNLSVELPDGTLLPGSIGKALPSVDPASQTQGYLIQVKSRKMIPENLVAKVHLIKSTKSGAISLPTEAVLSDETQVNFWVMKMINDSIAVKIPVKKGIVTNSRIEVLDPEFTVNDKFVVKGNFGLPDTALVRVQH